MKQFQLVCLLLLAASAVQAFELQSQAVVGNHSFDLSRTESLKNDAFVPTLAWGAIIQGSERLNENLSFMAGIERDATLRTLVTTAIIFDAGFARLTVGPFFGPFNSTSQPLTSGISTTLRLEAPGWVFGSFRADSTVGAGTTSPGDYVQQRSELLAGFWLPNLLISGRLASDCYSHRQSQDLLIVDRRTRYELITDVFSKGIPYTFMLKTGYENLQRLYLRATEATSDYDELGSIIAGLVFELNFSDTITVSIGGEAAVAAWAIGSLSNPPQNQILFTANLGLGFNLPLGLN